MLLSYILFKANKDAGVLLRKSDQSGCSENQSGCSERAERGKWLTPCIPLYLGTQICVLSHVGVEVWFLALVSEPCFFCSLQVELTVGTVENVCLGEEQAKDSYAGTHDEQIPYEGDEQVYRSRHQEIFRLQLLM